MTRIYADANATTPPCAAATAALEEALRSWGNPSSAHGEGRAARTALEKARGEVASRAGVLPKEVVFTSGGSEANALAIFGAYWLPREEPFELIVSPVEHSSVADLARFLETRGARVRRVRVDASGRPDPTHLEELLGQKRAHLVSVLAANNETGVLSPIATMADTCHRFEVPFHVDAVQAFGKLPAAVWNRADFLSLSAHKVQGPKGSGALVVRSGKKLAQTTFGGAQETKRRAGTENVLGHGAFGAACASEAGSPERWHQVRTLRERFEARLLATEPEAKIFGATADRLPNTTLVRFPGISGEILLTALDLDGIAVSTGSACSSGSLAPSPVLLAMGYPPDQAREALRVSFGPWNEEAHVDTVADVVLGHVRRIRSRTRSAGTRHEATL